MERRARWSTPTRSTRCGCSHELSPRLPDDAIVTADSGSAANWYARHLRIRGDMRGSLSGTLATMGPGVPYAIGAKFAHPDRPAIAFVGDGAMQMNGLAELITIAQVLAASGSDPRLVVAVLHNNDLNQVTWEMRAMGGAPQFVPNRRRCPTSTTPASPRSLGLTRHRASSEPERRRPAPGTTALAADRPFVLDVRTRPRRAADPAARHLRADRGRGRGACSRATTTAGASIKAGHQDQGAGVPAAHRTS